MKKNFPIWGCYAVSFDKKLKTGLLGESIIAKIFNRGGYNVLPAYEIAIHQGKGPRLFTPSNKKMVVPDMLVFKGKDTIWVEAKTKKAFTWHRKSKSFQTGIDLSHWESYKTVSETTPFPVWLFFLHRPGKNAMDTPTGKTSPSGLYGQEINKLKGAVDHVHENWGRYGMIYWQERVFIKFCEYNEIKSYSISLEV